jgi:hypothetical protein
VLPEPEQEPVAFDLGDLEFRDLLIEQFPHPLQTVVMPVIALRDGAVHLRGTAFSIGGNLALTATHVVEQDDDLEEVALLHVASVPDSEMVRSTLLPVAQVTAHLQTDVAVLRLDVAGIPFKVRPLRLGMAPPKQGEPCAIFGYRHEGTMGSAQEVRALRPQLFVSQGKVVDHYPTGAGIGGSPCFQIDGRADHQMSGGPILSTVEAGLMAVRGIVSTGYTVEEGKAPLSFGAMTFTAMALDPLVEHASAVEPTYLFDLADAGAIPVVDLSLVDFDRTDPERPRLALRDS